MSLLIPSVATIIAGNEAACGILGVSQTQLANAIATGFTQYILSSVTITTADVGNGGSGVGLGQSLFVASPALQAALTTTFSGAGILGVFQQPLILAIANSISQSLLTATLSTVNVGVGTGTGIIATVIPNTPAHVASMFSAFSSNGIIGVYANPLATAIAVGIDSVLPSARGFVIISGPSLPFPSTGAGFGRIL